MIFITVISNLGSTLTRITEDIEKEEVVAFNTYIRLAKGHYAAVDSRPGPPNIPTRSQPTRGNGSSSSKEKRASEQVALTITPNVILRQ
ncbi:hypothetical protein EV44_g3394 [Erysiphe necator]|uniref:Uncharacterized protein n=1 Tax=Uncinula necator TaxID=52586 RepID=A0A0B1P2H4_UNCNE|nr:hypothetical protein EV44_g3394 [Erysiphe necator]